MSFRPQYEKDLKFEAERQSAIASDLRTLADMLESGAIFVSGEPEVTLHATNRSGTTETHTIGFVVELDRFRHYTSETLPQFKVLELFPSLKAMFR